MAVVLEVENDMITNQRKGEAIKPVVFYLFAWRVRTFKNGNKRRSRMMHTIEAPTMRGAESKLERFIARKDVVLIGKGGRRMKKP